MTSGEEKKQYTAPRLQRYGKMTLTTQGMSGPGFDGMSGMAGKEM